MRLFLLILALCPLIAGCFRSGFGDTPVYPDISNIYSSLSDQFILDSVGQAQVSRAHPFKGAASSCVHQGAHLNFTNTGAPYVVSVYSPVDGSVLEVDACDNIGASDRYLVSIAFAKYEEAVVSLVLSFEPNNGTPCSSASGSADAFSQYIQVAEGQDVSKGEAIAQFSKADTGNDNGHIHFHLEVTGEATEYCPNIFNNSVNTTFAGLFGTETCNGNSFGNTFCYLPETFEDLQQVIALQSP